MSGMVFARTRSLVAFLLLFAASAAAAQSATGDIQGTVVDESDVALAGVMVTITNTATGARRILTTDAAGLFTAPGLPVGPYNVQAELRGFAILRQHLRLRIGERMTLHLELRTAAVAETITIAPTLPFLETARSQVSSVVDAAALANLPANGRHVVDFVLLTPGVTRDVRAGDVSFAGQRGTLNSLIVDGVDNNNTFFGQTLGRSGSGRAPYQFSQEAVQELQVNSSAYTAEYGRAGGGVINVVTKSGSNALAGSAFEFFRNAALTANTAIDDALVPPRPKPPYRYNQFGGVAGGPLVEDRHFFFASYDGLRSTQPNVVFLNLPPNVPTDADTQAAIARLQPLAESWERRLNQDVFLIKTDHQLTDRQRLTLRYNHQNFTGGGLEAGGPQIALESTGDSKVFTRTFSATVASVLGPSLSNEARVQIARDREPGEANSDAPQATIRQSGTDVLRIGRNFFSPRETTIDRLQIADTLTWVRGAHKVKAGVDLQFDEILNVFPGNFSGVYLFTSLASFNRGVPNGPGETYTQAFPGIGTSGPTTRPDMNELSIFGQDEWRVSPALTLNLGIRYDLQTFAQPPVRNPDPQLAAAGIDTSVLSTDSNNLAPRAGIAWAPLGQRYVVRGGYGVFYGRTPAIMVGTAHANNGTSVQTITFRGASGDPVPRYPNRFADIPAGVRLPRPTIFAFDPEYENARVQQASAGIEWEWMPQTSLAVGYLFARGDHLPRATDINVGPPSPITLTRVEADGSPGGTLPHYRFASGPLTNFARVISFQSTAESRYNGLTIELNRRFHQNYYYRVAYTLGRVVDTVPDATAVVPESPDDRKFASNPASFEADRAPGDDDQHHRLVASVIFSSNGLAERFDGLAKSFVRDWTLSAIYTAQRGQPFSAYASGDINGDNNRFNDIAPGTTRNQFRLPAFSSLDPRVARDLRVGDDVRLTLIWEAYNLFNRANDNVLNNTLYNVVGTELRVNPLFGQATGQADPRIMQLGVRVVF